jgi:hypothetical protein
MTNEERIEQLEKEVSALKHVAETQHETIRMLVDRTIEMDESLSGDINNLIDIFSSIQTLLEKMKNDRDAGDEWKNS